MSKNITEDLFDMPPSETKPKAAKKATAKKATAAKKTATKKTAKKAVTKKTVAKKAAKKVTIKSTEEESAEETPKQAEPTEKKAPKPIEAPKPLEAPSSENSHDESPRNGRVPGGGPVNQPSHQTQNQTHSAEPSQSSSPNRESRSKKRREKRKRRRQEQKHDGQDDHSNNRRHNNRSNDRGDRQREDRAPAVLSGPLTDAEGLVEMTPKGYGFLRKADHNFAQEKDDIFISPELVRNNALRHGQWIIGKQQDSNRGAQLVEVISVNLRPPEEVALFPHFDELTAINPNKRITFETTPDRYTTRVVDIISPVGRGQRGLIVSPPRSGKTTLLLHMAEAVREKYDEQIHLMVLLVDERPEEVTEFRRALPGAEIYASSNDEAPRNHCRIAELAIERAKRLVEAGEHVFLLMDSITRLARAYNGAMSSGKGGRGRATGSGGVTIGALEVPRRLFAAARNTREAGSLTILATALIQTNSRADEAIFMEFKGTGNMELVLDRKIAESYVYPAADIFRSGTRREELLLPEHTLHKIHLIRRGLSGHRPHEAMERLLYFIKKFPNNPQMLMEIKG